MAALTTQAEVTALRDYYFKVLYVGAVDEPNSGETGWFAGTDKWSLIDPTANSAALTALGYEYSSRVPSTAQKVQDDLMDLLDTAEDTLA